jgi:1L-myo-inositol 1-phosphate cytidylyltransferase / CDP-L-myo-inositol myo-inositolphosphotransferase
MIFLLVTTLDGVDGELARLKLCETEFGAKLDVTTDALVNAAVILGIILGCYRETHARHYLLLVPVFIGGFSLCGIVSYIAIRSSGNNAQSWLFERLTSRDFAYLLVIFAAVRRLDIVAWGASFVSYLVALILFLLVVTGWVRQPSLPRT